VPFGLSLQSSDSCDWGILYRLIGHEGITLICDVRSGCAIGQPVIIQSTLIINGRVSDIFVIEIKELAMFQSVKYDSSQCDCSDSRRKLGDQVREDYYPESLSPLFVSERSVK
jgi:hypothetical protein